MKPRSTHRSRGRSTWARDSQRRPEKRTILIVCEGRETERNYLDGLKREDSVTRRFTVTVSKGRGGTRQQIVQRTVDRKNDRDGDFDEFWCVMDVERLDTEGSRTDLKAAILIACQNQVTLYLSNPAFEVWILSHFIRSSRQFNGCDAVVRELSKYWRAEFQVDYFKNDNRIYPRIADRTSAAIENARAVREHDHRDKVDIADCNSATEMYRLVRNLTQ